MKKQLRCCLFRYKGDWRQVICGRKAKLRRIEILQARFHVGRGSRLADCYLANRRLPICDGCIGQ